MITHGRGRPALILITGLVASVMLGACSKADPEIVDVAGGATSGAADAAGTMDPCGGADHPCTLGEVSPAARARTHELTAEVIARLDAPDASLQGIVAWLRSVEDVAHVSTGSEGLRFRVRGGRGHWLLLQTSGTIATLSAPPPTFPANRDLAFGAAARQDPARSATTGHQRKRALLVSPFRWQWQIERLAADKGVQGPRYAPDGIDQIAQALRARDYAEVTVMTEALHPTDPTRTIGGVGLEGFTTWDDYDYVHLLTHGGSMCDDQELCMSALLAP